MSRNMSQDASVLQDASGVERSVAVSLREAYRGAPVAPVRDRIPDVQAAYRVQEANTRTWLDEGRALRGRKIGLTSPAVQRQLGVHEPDYGMLFADMCVLDGDIVALGALLQPKVEAEIAFVLGRGLAREGLQITDVISAVEYCLPALEIVDSRIAGWDIRLVDTVADNASSALYVLGTRPVTLGGIDLPRARMRLLRSDAEVSHGDGRACLGNPLHAALWLARTMVACGRPLGEGDVVLAGALGPMVAPADGDRFRAEIEGVGVVEVGFSGACRTAR